MNESLDPKCFPHNLSKKIQKTLAAYGVGVLQDLAHFKKSEIRNLPGIGPLAMSKIRNEMIEKGVSFKNEYK